MAIGYSSGNRRLILQSKYQLEPIGRFGDTADEKFYKDMKKTTQIFQIFTKRDKFEVEDPQSLEGPQATKQSVVIGGLALQLPHLRSNGPWLLYTIQRKNKNFKNEKIRAV
jgi:hypothetical protein